MSKFSAVSVSRETLEDLKTYEKILLKWNPRINLVSSSTLADLDQRHFEDSLQLLPLCPSNARSWIDIGSGGGFPGLVCAIASRTLNPYCKFILVESDARKCAFLNAVLREIPANATVLTARAEDLKLEGTDILSARALAPIEKLFELSIGLRNNGTVCLFPKGASCEKEILQARREWSFTYSTVQSKTDPEGSIAVFSNVIRKEE